jgi:hypothetical protein
MHSRLASVLVLAFLCLAACADVEVCRVSSGDYDTKGFRYYRPRPYVAVAKPFAVGGGDFFTQGTVGPDGNVVTIDATSLPAAIREHFGGWKKGDGNLYVPVSLVSMQAEEPTGEKPKADPKKDPKDDAKPEQPKTSASVETGGNPNTHPVLDVNEYLKIVYLPDFDEQYAIRARAGLGQAIAKISLEQGWMLEKADLTIDNRELGKFIFSNVQKFIDIGEAIAKQGVGLGPAPQGEEVRNKIKDKILLLRVRYLINAAPGLYPVLKPAEYCGTKNEANQPMTLMGERYIFVPYPPLTVVAYNYTVQVMIESISTITAKPSEPKPSENTPLSEADKTLFVDFLNKFKIGKKEGAAQDLKVSDFKRIDSTPSAEGKVVIHSELESLGIDRNALRTLNEQLSKGNGELKIAGKTVTGISIDAKPDSRPESRAGE